MFPKLKKRLSGFLLNEDGKISKEAMLALGAVLGSVSVSATHTNDLTASYNAGANLVVGTHAHHSSATAGSGSGSGGDACACPSACGPGPGEGGTGDSGAGSDGAGSSSDGTGDSPGNGET